MSPADESDALVSTGLEAALGYRFRNRRHLICALTHRSHSSEFSQQEGSCDNERLEFLGDSVLGFIASEALAGRNPTAREGVLSSLKSHLVSSSHLYQCAVQLRLGQHLVLGKGEERNGGRAQRTLLANALEAVIAAIYLDGGIEPARSFILANILQPLENDEQLALIQTSNHKSLVQERAQALGLPVPSYTIVSSRGPEHARVFTVEGRIGAQYSARASGSSKKIASQGAAEVLLDQLSKAADKS